MNQLLGMVRDVTYRKLAELELERNNAFSKSLLKAIPFGIDIVDNTGTVLYQNDFFEKIVGKNGIGKKCWEVNKAENTKCVNCPIHQEIKIGQTNVLESCDMLGDRVFEVRYTGMVLEGKKVLLKIFQDISQRKDEKMLLKV